MIQADTFEISLSGEAATQVRDALDSRKYTLAEEVVADALRHWHRERRNLNMEHLRAAWEEAVRDDSPGLEPERLMARVREKLASQTLR